MGHFFFTAYGWKHDVNHTVIIKPPRDSHTYDSYTKDEKATARVRRLLAERSPVFMLEKSRPLRRTNLSPLEYGLAEADDAEGYVIGKACAREVFRLFGGVVSHTFYDWLDEVVDPFVPEHYRPADVWNLKVGMMSLQEMHLYLVADLRNAVEAPVPEKPFLEF